MPAYETIMVHLPLFAVVLARLVGLFLFAPVLSSALLPGRYRALLVFMLALGVYPTLNLSPVVALELSLVSLAPILAAEVLIGVVIGIFALMPLVAVQIAGVATGQQMGLGLGQVVNPAADIEADQLGQILFMAALAMFIYLGGLDLMFGTVIETFKHVPPGGWGLDRTPLDLLTGLLSSAFVMAVRIALPVLVMLLLESLSLGFLMKTVPSINIMTVGFPIRLLLGLFVLLASLGFAFQIVEEDLHHSADVITRWTGSISPASTPDQTGGGR